MSALSAAASVRRATSKPLTRLVIVHSGAAAKSASSPALRPPARSHACKGAADRSVARLSLLGTRRRGRPRPRPGRCRHKTANPAPQPWRKSSATTRRRVATPSPTRAIVAAGVVAAISGTLDEDDKTTPPSCRFRRHPTSLGAMNGVITWAPSRQRIADNEYWSASDSELWRGCDSHLMADDTSALGHRTRRPNTRMAASGSTKPITVAAISEYRQVGVVAAIHGKDQVEISWCRAFPPSAPGSSARPSGRTKWRDGRTERRRRSASAAV